MKPEHQDLIWYRGDDPPRIKVTVTAAGEPVDLTGSTFLAQIRPTRDSDSITATLLVDTTDEANGVVFVTPSAANSEAVYASHRRGEWDLEWIDSAGRTKSLVTGSVRVEGDVSRG